MKEALKALEPFEEGMALALSTEGYSSEKDKLLAFSLAPLNEASSALVYVAGGDPNKNGNVNQIIPELYASLAHDPATAWEMFAMFAQSARFMVCHSAPFAIGFLNKLRQSAGPEAYPFDQDKIVDTLSIARVLGFGLLSQLSECDSVQAVAQEIRAFPTPKRADGSCGLKALSERLKVRMEAEGPLCERNALALKDVFLKMLEMPC